MVITPHFLIGAAIGSRINNWVLITVLAIISHIILDKIPHWGYGGGAFKRFASTKSYKVLFTFLFKIAIDALIAIFIVLSIAKYKEMINISYLAPVLFGSLIAILPDVFLGSFKLIYIKTNKPSITFIDNYKKIIHHSRPYTQKPTLLTIGTQIIVSIAAIFILLL